MKHKFSESCRKSERKIKPRNESKIRRSVIVYRHCWNTVRNTKNRNKWVQSKEGSEEKMEESEGGKEREGKK